MDAQPATATAPRPSHPPGTPTCPEGVQPAAQAACLAITARGLPLGRTQADLEALEEHRGLLDHDIVALKLKLQAVETSLEAHPGAERVHEARRALRQLLDRKRRNLRAVVQRRDFLSQQVDRAYNPYWGSTFKEGSDLSRFGEQVEDYACLYTSRVSNLLSYSPTQYFRAPRHWMAHEKA
ncbi:MAG: hypothetical protein KC933_10175 [Myxococcales bacterium]|nr:hypothetical protein [Myxococcales bacterium]